MGNVITATLLFVLTVSSAWTSSSHAAIDKEIDVAGYLKKHSEIIHCTPSATTGLNICPDRSYSFEQRETLFGTGICGPVAVANTIANLYRVIELPETLMAWLNQQQLVKKKGTSAEDLINLLKYIVKFSPKADGRRYVWKTAQTPEAVRPTSAERTVEWFIRPFKGQDASFLPTIVALRTEPSTPGHWTTVIWISENEQGDCRVVHNTWGTQYRTLCHAFRWLAKNARESLKDKSMVHLAIR